MSHDHAISSPMPRGALFAVGGMVVATLALTSAVGLGLVDRPKTAMAQRIEAHVAPLASRELRFVDRADGALVVTDHGRVAHVVAPGSNNGFIRGVLRGLARDRMLRGIGQEPPFRLTQWANGSLSLTDTATGRTIELGSFGATNRAAFAQMLPPAKVATR